MDGQTCHSSGVEALKQCHPRLLPVHRLGSASVDGLRPAYMRCLNSMRFQSGSCVDTFRLASPTLESSYLLPNVHSLNLAVAEFVGVLIPSSPHFEPSSSVHPDCFRSASGTWPVRIPKGPP